MNGRQVGGTRRQNQSGIFAFRHFSFSEMGLGDKNLFSQEKTIPKCHLGVKEKRNHNIGGVRLDCGAEVLVSRPTSRLKTI